MKRITMRLSVLASLVVMLLIFNSASAQTIFGLEIEISPEEPKPEDPITIFASGWWSTACTPYYVGHTVSVDHITIVTNRDYPDFCPTVLTFWSLEIELLPMRQGVYDVYLMGAVEGATEFYVLDPETLVNHSYLPVATR